MKNETLLKPNPKDQELEFHPCVNLHQEIISASVELCETDVCFLHIHEHVTSEMHKSPPDVDFESSSLSHM